jgi:hypothetical protein
MDGTVTTEIRQLDVLVVGAGFGGIYMLHKLRNDLGLDAVALDKAGGVGGTWYWNKYPGALSDSESFVYQYSFDRELYEQTPRTTKYVRQPQILDYLNGVVDRYDLRSHIELETTMTSAHFDEMDNTWTIETDRGVTYRARFLVNASACSLPRTSRPSPDWTPSLDASCTPAPGPTTWTSPGSASPSSGTAPPATRSSPPAHRWSPT